MRTSTSPVVSIIIPVFNHADYTRGCLEAIEKAGADTSYEILVADDCSTDGTAAYLEGLGDAVRWIRASANQGFIRNCNNAAGHARGEYLVFLNNDTLPQKGWLDALLEPMHDSTVGVTGARMIWPDGRMLEAGSIVFSDGSAWNIGRGEPAALPKFNHVREVDYVSGGGLMVRRSLWERLGGFDTRYCPAYYDDIDLCFAARQAGYKVLYIPFSWIVHFEGVTGGKDTTSGVKRYQIVNREKFREKWRKELKAQFPPDPANVARASWRGEGKNVLWIDHMLPVPNFNSGCLRMNHLLHAMVRQGHHVTYATLVGTDPGNYGRVMQEMGVRVVHLGYEEWEFLEPRKKDVVIDTILEALELTSMRYDVIYLSFYWVGMHFINKIRRRLPSAIIYVDSHDIHFLRTAREAELHPDDQHVRWAQQTRRDELTVYSKADAVMTVTEQDREVLKEALPNVPVFLMPNVHDVVPCETRFPDRQGLLFVGGFNHTPNVDAMAYFCREIVPALRTRLPGFKLWIVGSNPTEEVKALACDDIVVTGWVDSTKPYLDSCRISVAPIRYGAGMKGKIGEAMAHGLPVITTPVGAEGMEIRHEQHALIASTAEEWVDAIVRLNGDEALWKALSAGGQELMRERYGTGAMDERTKTILSFVTRQDVARAGGVAGLVRRTELVSIVILTHNQLSYTKECLASIRKHTRHPHEIVVVDNASTDGTPEALAADLNVTLISNTANRGFPAGCNQGIRASKGDAIVLLNNDTVVTEGWLEGLLDAAARNPAVGIVGPVSNAVSGPQQVKNARYKTMAEMRQFARKLARQSKGQSLDFPRVAFLCALIKREVFDAIGGLDERFTPGNYEDDDFCLRSQLSGFRTTIAQDVFIHHYGSVSFKASGNEAYASRLKTNREIFVRKWGFSPDDIWLKGKLPRQRRVAEPFGDDDADRLVEQASLLVADGETSMAMETLRRALDVPSDTTALSRQDLLNRCAVLASRAGEFDAAETWFKEEEHLTTASSRPIVGLGMLRMATGDHQEAIRCFTAALERDPLDQAAAESLEKATKAAAAAPQTILENTTMHPAPSVADIEMLYKAGRYQEAATAARHLSATLGEGFSQEQQQAMRASLASLAGGCYIQLSDLENAKQCFEEALHHDPASSSACAGLGEVFASAGLDRESKTMYEWAVKNDPSNLQAVRGLGEVNARMGFAGDDNSLLNGTAASDHIEQRVAAAMTLFRDGDHAGSIKAIEGIEDLLADQAPAEVQQQFIAGFMNLRGLNYLALKDPGAAKMCFESALHADPESAQACLGLGEVFYQSGEFTAAKTMYEWAIRNGGDTPVAKAGLASANRALGLSPDDNSLDAAGLVLLQESREQLPSLH